MALCAMIVVPLQMQRAQDAFKCLQVAAVIQGQLPQEQGSSGIA